MKKHIIIIVALCTMTSAAKADLVVDSLGRVNMDYAKTEFISIEDSTNHITIDPNRIINATTRESIMFDPTGGIYFKDDSYNSFYNSQREPFAFSVGTRDKFTAYFFNGASYSNYPVIMSQTTHFNGELFRGCYNTNITLRIRSDGSIFTATGVYTLSDGSHKNDIQTVDNALIALQEVKPVSYTLTIDSKNTGITTAQQVKRRTTNSDETANNDVTLQESMTTDLTATIEAERKRPKYGFVAQEIEQILPNVVYTMPNGEKAIAYQEIIPLLVGAVKELNNHIDSLATRIEELENPTTQQRQQAPAALQEAIADGSAALMQNTPNPFNQATEIAYRLPEGTATAMIMLCDMNGKMLQTYPLAVNTTAGTLTIQAGSYSPGMYLYTLLIDGVQIDTKQMIILAH